MRPMRGGVNSSGPDPRQAPMAAANGVMKRK